MADTPRTPLRPVPRKPTPVKVSADDRLRADIEAVITAMNTHPPLHVRKDLQDDATRAVFRYFAAKMGEK